MNNNLNIKIQTLRNASSSPDAYPVRTNLIGIDEFLTKYGKPITNDIVVDNVGQNFSSYCGVKTSEDALSEDLGKVCMAYDDESDRGIVWVTEPWRVPSYKKSILNGSHIGIIGLIDLKSNIESFKYLLNDIEWEDCLDEIQSEINYWQQFVDNGFDFFVIVGKNRSLYAIPTIYAESIIGGKYEQLKEKFFVEVKVWTKYVTKSFKTELYRNEKQNMKDTLLMELIGWQSPITNMIYRLTKIDLAKRILPELFDFDKRVLYHDRELVLDCYALYCEKYGDNDWIKTQFEKSIKIKKGKVDFEKVWELFLNVMHIYKSNKQKISDGQTFKMLVFYSCLKYLNSPLDLNLKGTALYSALYQLIVNTHIKLDDKLVYYGWKSGGSILLNFSELKSGMKSSSGYFKSDYSALSSNEVYDEAKIGTVYHSKKQGDVLLEIWLNQFFDFLQEQDGVVIPAKRNFDSSDISHIVRRDSRLVRINGEIYNSNNEPIKFSDVYPDDSFILKYGTNTEYVRLPIIDVMSTDIQVDHIPCYSKNKSKKDLDKCELTTSTFNNWKNDREAVYESSVLELIQERKEGI
jgi:hypothetical protein